MKEKNIIIKTRDFIKNKLLKKEEVNLEKSETPIRNNNNFINELKEERRILDIQKMFENGEIQEADLTEEEKRSLITLYNKQIDSLKNDIEGHKRTLKLYREKYLHL